MDHQFINKNKAATNASAAVSERAKSMQVMKKHESGTDKDGAHIYAGAHYSAEVEREMNIARGEGAVGTRARLFLTEHMQEVVAATSSFNTYAQSQIDSMEGDPSDYWALVPVLAGLVGSAVTVFIPGVNVAIGVAIAAAVEGAVQTAATAETKSERGDAKERAKAAMRAFARQVETGQHKGVQATDQAIAHRLMELGVMDEGARALLEVAGDTEQETLVINYLGIPDPTESSPFQPVLKGLMGQFAAWLTRQKLNQGRTGIEKMIGEAPGTDQYKKDQQHIGQAKNTAEQQADDISKQRSIK